MAASPWNSTSPFVKVTMKTKENSQWMKRHAELKDKKMLKSGPVYSASHALRGLKLASTGQTRERDCVDIAFCIGFPGRVVIH